MQADLCVFLAGHNLDTYTPLFIETLYKNCDVSNLHIHVVEKGAIVYTGPKREPHEHPWYIDLPFEYYVPGVGDNVHNYLLRKQAESKVPFTIYEEHNARKFFTQSVPGEPFWAFGDDHGNTLNWAMENCGKNKWIIFCHSDMIFRGDIITSFIDDMHDWVGMFGLYNHCYAVNREAYFKVGIKFNCITNFRAVPVKHQGFDFEIRHASDPRCPLDESKIIYGFDIGEWMEIMMIANRWYCNVINPVRREHHMMTPQEIGLMQHVDHMCSGHGYVNNATLAHQESRRQEWLKQYGVKKV
uniref:Uncharacterized protein n=1 Tax=viral metagenome TaxID=1070528 RepID=A0A6M3ITA0_9ZZZZ